jgi:hypothetical protein
MITQEESLVKAKQISSERDGEIDFNLPMAILITEIYRLNTQGYGAGIPKKIIQDSQGILTPCHPDFGDAYGIFKKIKKFFELKSSYSRKSGRYGIAHIRDYQTFDYFIICFVDREDNFKPYFYLLTKSFICDNFKLKAMNNTDKANKDNVNIDKTMSISKEKAYYMFGEANLLNGTSYQDLMDFLRNAKPEGNMLVNPHAKMYQKHERFKFDANGVLIEGKTNIEAIINLANHLGPLTSTDYFPPSWLSKTPSELRNTKLKLGNYYLNPKISIRDARYIINRGNKKTNRNVRLIED